MHAAPQESHLGSVPWSNKQHKRCQPLSVEHTTAAAGPCSKPAMQQLQKPHNHQASSSGPGHMAWSAGTSDGMSAANCSHASNASLDLIKSDVLLPACKVVVFRQEQHAMALLQQHQPAQAQAQRAEPLEPTLHGKSQPDWLQWWFCSTP